MNITLSQRNFHIGNFTGNKDKIIADIQKAKADKSDLIVFSELSVCGYPPLDLLEQKDFIEKCIDTINEIATYCKDIAAIVGGPTINREEKGKKLYNSAFFLKNGKVEQVINKTLLPTYDIFDEYRYFEPNTEFSTINYKGAKIALTICEDIWDNQVVENAFAKAKIYKHSPMDYLMKQNPDLIINIAASPFSYNQEGLRTKVLSENAQRYNLPIIYVNEVGANTEIIFDGRSKVVNAKGDVLTELNEFAEDYISFNLDSMLSQEKIGNRNFDKIEKIHDALILGIKDYFAKMNFKTATLGLSGGIDSAVTLALAQRALGSENLYVLLLPSQFSSDHSLSDAIELAENLSVKYDIIPIKDIFGQFEKSLNPIFKDLPFNLTEENIQARIRGTLLMGISNKFGNILLNTSNKSEAAVGYSTMYGDMNGGLSVLGDVYKTDVFALARYINKDDEVIPENSITKPPSAELRPDQKDSDSLPDYDILDGILFNYIEQKLPLDEIVALGYDKETVTKTIQLVNRNEYKRFQTPPILRVSSKAFGFGRIMPLVAKY